MTLGPLGNDAEIRNQLARLARQKHCRTSAFSREMPTEWQPYAVFNPEIGMTFTEASAWEFIAQRLQDGEPLYEVVLDKPRGCLAYEMLVNLTPDRPLLYIKIHLGLSGKIIGRSFHYSRK